MTAALGAALLRLPWRVRLRCLYCNGCGALRPRRLRRPPAPKAALAGSRGGSARVLRRFARRTTKDLAARFAGAARGCGALRPRRLRRPPAPKAALAGSRGGSARVLRRFARRTTKDLAARFAGAARGCGALRPRRLQRPPAPKAALAGSRGGSARVLRRFARRTTKDLAARFAGAARGCGAHRPRRLRRPPAPKAALAGSRGGSARVLRRFARRTTKDLAARFAGAARGCGAHRPRRLRRPPAPKAALAGSRGGSARVLRRFARRTTKDLAARFAGAARGCGAHRPRRLQRPPAPKAALAGSRGGSARWLRRSARAA